MRAPSFDCAFTFAGDVRACRALLREGSRTFYAASFLLPERVRDAAVSLYAFCRQADDAIDLGLDRQAALHELRERLQLAYEQRPRNLPADRAFAKVVSEFAMPKEFPLALIEGFEWDAEGRRYETLADVTAYSVRVAGAVGAMMAVVMGVRDPKIVHRACELGTAMQFTNIARDVGEDARSGRLYLPLQWLREAGIDSDAFLRAPAFGHEIAGLIRRLLQEADKLYQNSGEGIAALPASCRPGILAARSLYAEIGREVARNGYDSISQRAVVSPRRKAAALANMWNVNFTNSADDAAPVREKSAHFISAVGSNRQPSVPGAERAELGIGERAVWIVDLFDRLGRRERLQDQRS